MKDEQQFFRALEHKIQLNDVQYKAVKHQHGPLLLLASPGSGKTTTIISRIAYLIQVKQVNPKHILAVSFSKASAQDLLQRFSTLFPHLTHPHFSTIHSLAYKIMLHYFKLKQQRFHIIEGDNGVIEAEQRHGQLSGYIKVNKLKLLSELYEKVNKERAKEEQLEELSTFISLIKNKALSKEQWPSLQCKVPHAIEIYEQYEDIKQHHYNVLLIDYDDMLTIARQALEEDSVILHYFQQRFSAILTDESQDTSFVQHYIIGLLAKQHQQLFVVADDDQAIYSWRGAEVTYLLQFKEHYPKAEILFLQQNYRSTKKIVEAANAIIKQNKSRYAKVMFTDNEEGQNLHFLKFNNAYKEAIFIAEQVQSGEQLGEIAVLYRNHISNILLVNELDKRQIPFYMKDADDRFFKHWVIQDILNIFRLSYSDKHFHVFEAVAMKLQLYLSFDQLAELKQMYQGESILSWIEKKMKLESYQLNQLTLLQAIIPTLKTLSPKLAIVQIREQIGYNKVIKQLSERLGFKFEYLNSILDSLELIAEDVDTLIDFVDKLKHLEKVQHSARRLKGKQAVTLSTLHSAKGLEFDSVYMMDLIEGVIPSRHDTERIEMLEEAVRLFYVGMTRAKRRLYLLSVEQWFGQAVVDSRFVKQLNKPDETRYFSVADNNVKKITHITKIARYDDSIKDAKQLVVDSFIEHQQFGVGQIIENDGIKIKIEFKQTGLKVLVIAIVLENGIVRLIS